MDSFAVVKTASILTACVVLAASAVDLVIGVGSPSSYEGSGATRVASWSHETAQPEYSATNLFYWVVYMGEAYVSGYPSTNQVISIPPKYYGFDVVGVSGDNGGFYYKEALRSVTFPDTFRDIGSSAFRYCLNLTNVVFGTGLQSIGSWTFSGVGNGRSVTFRFAGSAAPTLGTDTFGEGTVGIVYYPSGATGFTNPWGGLQTVPY